MDQKNTQNGSGKDKGFFCTELGHPRGCRKSFKINIFREISKSHNAVSQDLRCHFERAEPLPSEPFGYAGEDQGPLSPSLALQTGRQEVGAAASITSSFAGTAH